MADFAPVSRELTVSGLGDETLGDLLGWLRRPTSFSRWAVAPVEDGWLAAFPPRGEVRAVADGASFLQQQSEGGLLLSAAGFAAFRRRFSGVTSASHILMVAAIVAPLLPDLHPNEVRGIGYTPVLADRTRMILSVLARFFPKSKALALRYQPRPGAEAGLYVEFNGRRQIARLIGQDAWPDAARSGDLGALRALGPPVEIGGSLSFEGGRRLIAGGLHRNDYAALFRAGDVRIDPAPLALRLAMKAVGFA